MPNLLNDRFEKVIFVVSTGRTGTQAIATYFDQEFPQITALHEPAPSRRFRVLSNMRLCGKISNNTIANAYISARRHLLQTIESSSYLEANPFLHGCLPAIHQIFPDSYLVHVVRDPRTYIPSHINHGVFQGIKGLAGAYFPYWLLKPENYENMAKMHWHDMRQQERLAWRWNTINKILDESSELFRDRYLRIRFEDLFDAQKSGFHALADWLSLDNAAKLSEAAGKKRHNASQKLSCPPFESWESGLQDAVIQQCTDRMNSYGYE